MDNLLAGVAHELNSPLSVILGQVGLFAATAADDSARAQVREIGEAAERCVRIVRGFLTMARRHPPERGRVSLNQLLRDAVELLAFEATSPTGDGLTGRARQVRVPQPS
ncbi:MAG TPA: histidine kinase dimerization/phospho-acceptor domain-containing protein [Thermoanaerobaculia bacterium]|nr:histidine kinase dimerization/phospho-acceptor domain-containing protein [Thermoanaerobaculia bacterium]